MNIPGGIYEVSDAIAVLALWDDNIGDHSGPCMFSDRCAALSNKQILLQLWVARASSWKKTGPLWVVWSSPVMTSVRTSYRRLFHDVLVMGLSNTYISGPITRLTTAGQLGRPELEL